MLKILCQIVNYRWIYGKSHSKRFQQTKRYCIGVGAQSTLGGHKIFARKIYIKNQQKCPNFT